MQPHLELSVLTYISWRVTFESDEYEQGRPMNPQNLAKAQVSNATAIVAVLSAQTVCSVKNDHEELSDALMPDILRK